jgi:hypothetical protein
MRHASWTAADPDPAKSTGTARAGIEMSTARGGGRYRSPSEWHDVLVTRDSAGRWQVLDAAGSEIVVVETLTGHDDRLDQALAVARDYATEQQAYQDGRRDFDPFPAASRMGEGRDMTA